MSEEVINKTTKRRGNMSEKQKKTLVEFMQQHEELRKGKFSPTFTNQVAKKMWYEIGNDLNAIPGAKKSADQWKQTWFDLKKNAKKKNTDLKKYSNATGGGGPSTIILSDIDETVLGMINKTSLEGDNKVEESRCIFGTLNDVPEEENRGENIDMEIDGNLLLVNPNDSKSDEEGKQDTKIEVKVLKPKKNEKNQALENHKALLSLTKKDVQLKKEYWQEKIKYLQEDLALKREDLEIKKKCLNILEDIREILLLTPSQDTQ